VGAVVDCSWTRRGGGCHQRHCGTVLLRRRGNACRHLPRSSSSTPPRPFSQHHDASTLLAQVYNAARFGVDLSQLPTVARVNEHLASLPQFIAAHPQQQGDAPAGPSAPVSARNECKRRSKRPQHARRSYSTRRVAATHSSRCTAAAPLIA
jgi:hypothetical protein